MEFVFAGGASKIYKKKEKQQQKNRILTRTENICSSGVLFFCSARLYAVICFRGLGCIHKPYKHINLCVDKHRK